MEQIEHEGQVHAGEDRAHRLFDPGGAIGQDHRLRAVQHTAPLRLPPHAGGKLGHPTGGGSPGAVDH